MAIPMSTSTSNSAFSIETTSINPILNGLDPDIVEALVCGKEWSENPIRITSNGDNEHSPELTHTSFVLAGASLSLETQEKHAPSSANMELMLTKNRVTPNRDNEHSPEITQNSIVFPWAFLSFEPQQEHAPSSANSELRLANHSSTSCPEPLPTGHSSFVSAGASLSLEAQEKHASSCAIMELMPVNLSPTMYQNHHPPSLFDEVWRLENIGKDGALHKRLSCESINTVKDFLTLLFIDPARLQNSDALLLRELEIRVCEKLRSSEGLDQLPALKELISTNMPQDFMEDASFKILGTGISAKMWEVTVEHAQTCVLEKRMFLYSPPSSQQKNGVVFNVVGQVMGLLLECQYVPIDKLSETEKADAHNLVISAFKHLGEVVSFDDEASLVGSSSHLTNVCTASLPRTESSNVSKFMASHKIGAFDYTQQSAAIGRARMRWTKLFSMLIWFSIRVALRKQVLGTGRPVKMWKDTVESAQTCVLEKRMFLYSSPPSSPDIISSIYSVGGSSGFDDYDLPSVDSMGLRYEQASSFLESMKHSFDDDDLKFFYTGLF
nr:isoform 2 of calmodulin-binding protein 60 a [Quercus suber]